MKNNEFYNTISYIYNHTNTISLINIKEFKRLTKVNGEYKWIPFKIGSLPAIPVKTENFKEKFKITEDIINIELTPVWTYLCNGKQIITPNIEKFNFTEYSNSKPRYKLSRQVFQNHHYLSNCTWENIFDKDLAQEENAIEWDKKSNAILLAPISELLIQQFLKQYFDELQEFNNLYEESAKKTLEIKYYQKKIN